MNVVSLLWNGNPFQSFLLFKCVKETFIKSIENVVECNCVTGEYSMLIEVEFIDTEELDEFINNLQQYGKTRTQIVFSTPVEHRGVPVHSDFISK